jgi:hypothetical protein
MALPPVPLRYVVLRHEGFGDPHFDVMFETAPQAPLATWRAQVWPPKSGDYWTRLGDHRRDYLTYEGPVSRGRGEVRRTGAGSLETYRQNDDRSVSITLDTGLELELVRDGADRWLVGISA